MPRLCLCIKPPEEDVHVLDYRHCSLDFLPSDVFTAERTLEELYLDANQIRDLPRELFYCHGLRKLTVSDNDLISIPPAIASLVFLEHLDFSKNGVIDLPENIKQCKNLGFVEASVNPLGKLPEGFTQLLNLTELYLNDTFLDYLPGSFGRLTKLKILEVRENHLKTLPKSLSRLICLERLDIGNNDFTEIPEVVGTLGNLLELWCDTNLLTAIPPVIGELKQLMFLDASKNRIEHLPAEIQGCVSLADLHLSINLLQTLPETLGRLSNLTTFKVDDNRLTNLPFSIGGLVSLSELNISANDLEELPPSIGLLRHLRTLYADENFIVEIPPELGSCSGLTVLSMRSNSLTYVPDELGRIPRLRVLNLSDNRLSFLPYSLTRLKEIQALWLAENQTKPLVRLQSEIHEDTGQRVLTCYLLPQQPHDDKQDMYSDTDSFHPSMWEEEREQRQQIKFDFGDLNDEELSRLKRTPTPYPKEMKHRIQHMRNLALKQANVGNGEAKGGTGESKNIPRGNTQEQYQRVEGRGSNRPATSTSHDVLEFWDGPVCSTSPLMGERHILLRADKEKHLRDKARIRRRHSQGYDSGDSKSNKSTESLAKGSKSKGRRKGADDDQDDDGGFTDGAGSLRHQHNTASPPSGRRGVGALPASQPYPGGQGVSSHPQYASGEHVLSSDASYPSHIQPAYQPLPHLVHQPATHAYQDVPRSYADFIRDLQAKNDKQRGWRGGGAIPQPRPSSYHSGHRPRRSGYDSDVGYRSEGVGYTDGYRSDAGQGRSAGHASGYYSDWGGGGSVPSRRHKHNTGYASDFETYSRRKQNKHYDIRNALPQFNHSDGNQVINYQTANGSQGNVSVKQRTRIRNDEMYKQKYAEDRSSNRILDSSHHASLTAHPNGSHNTHKDSTTSAYSQSNHIATHAINSNASEQPSHVEDRQSGRERKEEREGSSDDDRYRAQLYEASVRLQKSPNDSARRRKQKNMAGQDKGGSGSPHKPGPWTDVYASPLKSQSIALSSSSHTDSPRSQASSQGHASGQGRGPTNVSAQGHWHNQSTSEAPYLGYESRQGQSIGKGQRRSYTSPARNSFQRPQTDHQDSPLASKSLTFTTPQKSTNHIRTPPSGGLTQSASSAHSFSATPTRNTPKQDRQLHTYPATCSSPPNSEQRPPNPPYTPQARPHVSTPSPEAGTAMSQDFSSPHRLSNYEQDVAVFKRDPASQVSSSTDSGYVQSQERNAALSQTSLNSPRANPAASLSSPSTQNSSTVASPTKGYPHTKQVTVEVMKNPGLGFSIAGGFGSHGNPYRHDDTGIFITKVQGDGPASKLLQPGDKVVRVNGESFVNIEHSRAVSYLRATGQTVQITVLRRT